MSLSWSKTWGMLLRSRTTGETGERGVFQISQGILRGRTKIRGALNFHPRLMEVND